MMASELITAPASEPVTLTEAKAQARVETTADDALITALITAARQWAENFTNRAFITQTWRLWLDEWPCGREQWWDGMRDGPVSGLSKAQSVQLPKTPLLSITSVTTYADDDSGSVWSAANYYADSASQPGRLVARAGASFPLPTRMANGIGIEYVAGYGASASAVPETVKTAIRQLVAHWYEHRGEAMNGGMTPPPLSVTALLLPYRVHP